MSDSLPFETAIGELQRSAAAVRAAGGREAEATQLETRARRQLADLYGRLTPWQRMMVARHPARPKLPVLVSGLFQEFTPLAGDRLFGDDKAIIGGLARFQGRPVMVIGHHKGEDTAGRVAHNFGMGLPEGYRKAVRLMGIADRFGVPVITLIDTPGAFPGLGAEERGQAEAIARCTQKCLEIGVPLIAVIVGEGGSGGAVALATADRVLMLEHAIYSVISPEGCASILWRSAKRAADAADALKITAAELLRLKVIDGIVYEPPGGAHRDPHLTIKRLATALADELAPLRSRSREELRAERSRKFVHLG